MKKRIRRERWSRTESRQLLTQPKMELNDSVPCEVCGTPLDKTGEGPHDAVSRGKRVTTKVGAGADALARWG